MSRGPGRRRSAAALLAVVFAFLAVGAVIGTRRFSGGFSGLLLAAVFALVAWTLLRAARRR